MERDGQGLARTGGIADLGELNPGGASDPISTYTVDSIAFAFELDEIGTNATIQLEGEIDGIWFTLEDTVKTVTTAGGHVLVYDKCAVLDSIRARFLAHTGEASPTAELRAKCSPITDR